MLSAASGRDQPSERLSSSSSAKSAQQTLKSGALGEGGADGRRPAGSGEAAREEQGEGEYQELQSSKDSFGAFAAFSIAHAGKHRDLNGVDFWLGRPCEASEGVAGAAVAVGGEEKKNEAPAAGLTRGGTRGVTGDAARTEAEGDRGEEQGDSASDAKAPIAALAKMELLASWSEDSGMSMRKTCGRGGDNGDAERGEGLGEKASDANAPAAAFAKIGVAGGNGNVSGRADLGEGQGMESSDMNASAKSFLRIGTAGHMWGIAGEGDRGEGHLVDGVRRRAATASSPIVEVAAAAPSMTSPPCPENCCGPVSFGRPWPIVEPSARTDLASGIAEHVTLRRRWRTSSASPAARAGVWK